MRVAVLLGGGLVALAGCGAVVVPSPTHAPVVPGEVAATLTVEVVNGLSVATRSTCDVRVTQELLDGEPYCRGRVTCGATSVYGVTPRDGYFRCSRFSVSPPVVVGVDDRTTTEDEDAAIHIDTTRATLLLRDDASGVRGAYSLAGRLSLRRAAE